MANRERFTKKNIEKALRKGAGIKSAAAKTLGCSPSTVINYVRRYKMEPLLAEIKDQMIDLAEGGLFEMIQAKDRTAIIFFLKTQAKDRGYVEGQQIGGLPGAAPIPMQHDLSKLSDEKLRAIHRILTESS